MDWACQQLLVFSMAPLKKWGAFRFALFCLSIHLKFFLFCDKDGKVGASVSYEHISSSVYFSVINNEVGWV